MSSLRNHEGYLFIDHSHAAPLPEQEVARMGLPPGAGSGMFETATYTCSHCQVIVVLNPKRDRERAYCRGCDHLICDACGVLRANGARCKTFKQVIDEALEEATRQADSSPLVLPQEH